MASKPRLTLLCIGKLKGDHAYLKTGVDEYTQRLQHYCHVKQVEVPEEPIRGSKTPAQVMAAEADRLRSQIHPNDRLVVLSERGKSLDSIGFSKAFEQQLGFVGAGSSPPDRGGSAGSPGAIVMVVGGPLGLASSLIEQAHWCVSLSPMTFPHPVARLLVLEQVYRAFRILHGQPYHK